MPLRQEIEANSRPPASTAAPPPKLAPGENSEPVLRFQALLREFLGAKEHPFHSLHTMSLNPRVNENRRGPVSNSSPFRGVTRHKYSSHTSARAPEGKQLYCGAFAEAADAAKAHDILALRLKKQKAVTNFLPDCYAPLLPVVEQLSEEEIIKGLRDRAQGGHEKMQRNTRQRLEKDISKVQEKGDGWKARGEDVIGRLDDGWSLEPLIRIETSLFPMVPLQDLTSPIPCAAASAPRYSPLGLESGAGREPAVGWPSLGSSQLSPQGDVSFPILQGHVIDFHHSAFLPLLEADAVSASNLTPVIEDTSRAKQEEASNGSCSDMEIQAAVRSISLHDEFEIQRHLDEGIVGFDPSNLNFFF